MVATGGSESVVTLLFSILDEEILVVSLLESESPSFTDVEASSFLDLVLEGTKSIELDGTDLIKFGSNLVEHAFEVGLHEVHVSSKLSDVSGVFADLLVLKGQFVVQHLQVGLKGEHVCGDHFVVLGHSVLKINKSIFDSKNGIFKEFKLRFGNTWCWEDDSWEFFFRIFVGELDSIEFWFAAWLNNAALLLLWWHVKNCHLWWGLSWSLNVSVLRCWLWHLDDFLRIASLGSRCLDSDHGWLWCTSTSTRGGCVGSRGTSTSTSVSRLSWHVRSTAELGLDSSSVGTTNKEQ
jgi:hypothetical protein